MPRTLISIFGARRCCGILEPYTSGAWWGTLSFVNILLTMTAGLDLPSGNETSSLKSPPSHTVFSFPGTPHSHFFRSMTPFVRAGFAKNPKGWSFRHCFLHESVRQASRGAALEVRALPFLRETILTQRHRCRLAALSRIEGRSLRQRCSTASQA